MRSNIFVTQKIQLFFWLLQTFTLPVSRHWIFGSTLAHVYSEAYFAEGRKRMRRAAEFSKTSTFTIHPALPLSYPPYSWVSCCLHSTKSTSKLFSSPINFLFSSRSIIHETHNPFIWRSHVDKVYELLLFLTFHICTPLPKSNYKNGMIEHNSTNK